MDIINFLSQPWHWSVSGVMIVVVMLLLVYFGQRFGISSSYKAICAIVPANRKWSYFNYDWHSHSWLLVLVIGSVIGGWIATQFLGSPQPVSISNATIQDLAALGINVPSTLEEGSGFVPRELFSFESLLTAKGFILLILGGFFIGFGTRYAGGCTSGHAISGLSNLQLPSLVAVIGFFMGGLLMTHILLPLILSL